MRMTFKHISARKDDLYSGESMYRVERDTGDPFRGLESMLKGGKGLHRAVMTWIASLL